MPGRLKKRKIMVKKIYVTDKLSPKIIFDDEGKHLCTFIDTKDNIIQMNEGLEKNDKLPNTWFVVLTDPQKIEKMEHLRGFGTIIKEVSSEPLIGQRLDLRVSVGSSQIDQVELKRSAEKAAREQTNKDMARYGQLFAQICKNGGSYMKDADPRLIQEFEQLKLKYGIEEEKNEEVFS